MHKKLIILAYNNTLTIKYCDLHVQDTLSIISMQVCHAKYFLNRQRKFFSTKY